VPKPFTLVTLVAAAMAASAAASLVGIRSFYGDLGLGGYAALIPLLVAPVCLLLSGLMAYRAMRAPRVAQRHVAFVSGAAVLGFALGPLALRVLLIM